jgi:hypothetical protein
MITNIENLVAVVGNDFIDERGQRTFNFNLCEKRPHGLVAVAIVDIEVNEVVRNCTVGALTHCRREIEALAFEYRSRSIPMTFGHR